jgi:hypothetical protein
MRRCLMAAVLFCSACESPAPESTAQSFIEKWRVLALRADPPALSSGETATLSALSVDPTDGRQLVAEFWLLCDPELPGQGGSPCLKDSLVQNPASAMAGKVPGVHVVAGPVARYAAPMGAYGAHPEAIAIFLAFDATNPERIGQIDTILQVAVKRISIIQPVDPRPANPAIGTVLVNGRVTDDRPMTLPAGTGSVSLEGRAVATATPGLFFSWYANGGAFVVPTNLAVRTQDGSPVTLDLPPMPSGVTLDIYVILRDARGGTSWTKRELTLTQ